MMASSIFSIFPPYPAPAAHPLPFGFSCIPRYSTYGAQPRDTRSKRGSMQSCFSFVVLAYALRCCTCARMPSCGVLKLFPVSPFLVTPMPQKLFCESFTALPEKVKLPVSRQLCAKAMSPRIFSASPSDRYSGIMSSTLCATLPFFALMYAAICSAVVSAFPVILVMLPLSSALPLLIP